MRNRKSIVIVVTTANLIRNKLISNVVFNSRKIFYDGELRKRKISMISKTSRSFKPTKAMSTSPVFPVAMFNFHETRDHASFLEQPRLKQLRNSYKFHGILLRGKWFGHFTCPFSSPS
ncbi:hypothetical protein PUN28_015999 [Cardiocondyla obscurior]|uniref:Uncharacterized protein n=1 Tax=Cardiocondyla obscurior TaxID=286306 RepID=A0AAW2EVR5_9HYME